MTRGPSSIWIDLDNSPHVPFFRPVIDALRERGHAVLVTARDAYNVTELLGVYGIECRTIGRHFGRNKAMKALGLGVRTAQLLPLCLAGRPALAVSHGARAQLLAARLLRVPSMLIADYEHVTHVSRPDCIVVPEVIPAAAAARFASRVLSYPGIKEDVYANAFVPDASLPRQLGLAPGDIVATVRPPATQAHYHDKRSDELHAAALQWLVGRDGVRVVLLPRDPQQKAQIRARFAEPLRSGRMILPERAVDGLNLVWHSDLVISGGGTMNREAAALGVPVYSTFGGPIGAVDRHLAAQGRLVLLERAQDVRRIVLRRRDRAAGPSPAGRAALDAIVRHIVEAAGTPALVSSVA